MTPTIAPAAAVTNSGTTIIGKHLPALDGLRGIAILWVLLHNAPFYSVDGRTNAIVWPLALVATVGWLGVQLFFVLSGFLITSNLLDTQHATNYYRTFFGRRVLRIFPLYFLALMVGLIAVPLFFPSLNDPAVVRTDQIWLWTFLFNWAHPLGTAALGFPHFWSLAVEEQFYLFWPFVVHKVAPGKLVKTCLSIAIVAFVVRAAMRSFGATPEMVYEFTVCRMDALVLGAAVATLLHMPRFVDAMHRNADKLLPSALLLALGGALSTWAYTRDSFATQTLGQSILAIVFAMVILSCTMGRGRWNPALTKLLNAAPLRSVGKYSFGMYVFHFPIAQGMSKLLPFFKSYFGSLLSIPFVALFILSTYAAAAVSYHLLEKRFLNLKRYFQPRRNGPALPAANHA